VTAIEERTAPADLGLPTGARRGHSADPTLRQRWQRGRILVAAAIAVVIGAVIVALGAAPQGGQLDPQSFDPAGSHALSALLGQRGVTVIREADASTAVQRAVSGSTLVVVFPQLLSSEQLGLVASSPADLVIVGAGIDELQGLSLSLANEPGDGVVARQPGCSLPAAQVAGSVELPGDGYSVPDGGQGCYPDNDAYALVTWQTAGHQVTLLSDGRPFTNSALARQGNAALALGLLDTHPDVVWLVPHLIAPASGSQSRASVSGLLPSRLKSAALQLAIAVVLIAVWRGRRFGRLVPEDVPVVVRQSETVRGRSRLYRRSRSLERAGDALREGTRHRLGHRLGQGLRPGRTALVEAVAQRARRSAVEIDALLYGSTPADDRAFVALAQALTTLEQEVLRT
jgi:hypothetical protein